MYKYNISHDTTGTKHLSTAADQELADDQLPAGHTPVWIETPGGATQVQMLERVETMAGQYQDIIVLYQHGGSDRRAAAWCEDRGWKYRNAWNIHGFEAQCVVLLCTLETELITRSRNMLIMLNKK